MSGMRGANGTRGCGQVARDGVHPGARRPAHGLAVAATQLAHGPMEGAR
jgi:hypothetical protein